MGMGMGMGMGMDMGMGILLLLSSIIVVNISTWMSLHIFLRSLDIPGHP